MTQENRYTSVEDIELLRRKRAGGSSEEIGKVLGRSADSVRRRAKALHSPFEHYRGGGAKPGQKPSPEHLEAMREGQRRAKLRREGVEV